MNDMHQVQCDRIVPSLQSRLIPILFIRMQQTHFQVIFLLIPEQAMTMAQHMRAGGYQTAMLTSNPNAGSATDRGVDTYRDAYAGVNSASSVDLHRNYWDWRAASPGEPYWVHFQTTTPHNPECAVAG